MDVIVLVKAVPDSEARISLRPDGRGLEIEEKWELNYFDELAVEEAVRVKERAGGGAVTAMAYGPKRSLEAVRKAVAMGADAAILIDGPDELLPDALATSEVLAACIKAMPFDLVWCGRRATDDDASQVGPMVAERLGIPHVSSVVAAAVEGEGSLRVTRGHEGGQEEILCPMPALLTAQKGLNEPRVPTVQGVMKGMRLAPKRMSASELGAQEASPVPTAGRWTVVGISEPRKRAAVRIIEGPDAATKARELVRLLHEELRLL